MEKKHILCISGGKDSTATAILALEHGEPIDMAVYCEVMFDENISGEVPEHRDFMYHTIIPWLEDNGIKVSVIRGGVLVPRLFFSCDKKIKKSRKKRKVCGVSIGRNVCDQQGLQSSTNEKVLSGYWDRCNHLQRHCYRRTGKAGKNEEGWACISA